MNDVQRIELASFAGGAVEELFKNDLGKIIDNIADPNTSDKAARKLSIEFKFVPMEGRDLVGVEVKTKTTLAPTEGTKTKMVISTEGDMLVAAEYNNQIKGQMRLDEETGEIMDDSPFQSNITKFKSR